MEGPPPLLEQRVVRDLVRKTMFESIFEIGEKARLVEKLRGLKVSEVTTKFFFRYLNDCLEQSEWHTLADNGC